MAVLDGLVLDAVVASAPTNLWQWLGDSSQRTVTGPIPEQLWATLWRSLLAFVLAALLAIPPAAWLAHRRRFEVVATWFVNLGRVIPTLAFLAFAAAVSLRNGYGFAPWPIVFALTALALPPLFANTYTGVRDASPEAVSAARAMGLTERQILLRVELPLAMPLLLAVSRVTLTQLVATEALAALFGGGGLGIYIRFGFAGSNIYQIQAGALLVAGTALTVDLVLAILTRYAVPAPLRPPSRRARRTPLLPARSPSRPTEANHQPTLRGTP